MSSRALISAVAVIALLGGVGLFLGRNGAFFPVRSEGPVAGGDGSSLLAQQQWQSFLKANFATDEACAECHVEEYEAHQRSGHSRTATPMGESDLAEMLSGTTYQDPQRQQVFRFEKRDDQFFVGIDGIDPEPVFPVHWLLGSGTHARTPVSIDTRTGHGVEFRWTWFGAAQRLGLTPDHERFDDFQPETIECFGRPLEPRQALSCVGCHMTIGPPEDVMPTMDAFIPNVSCERCHGPRRKHVEAARAGRASDVKPFLLYDDPESYIRQCAECHRDETNTPADSSPSDLARFQPYGLLKSECFLKSPEKMTCSTCHDPHDRVSQDRQHYIERCNQCHQSAQGMAESPAANGAQPGAAGRGAPAPEQPRRAGLCPVEPAGDCIQCHMPAVEWHSGIKFHDHWIRVPAHDEAKPAVHRTDRTVSDKDTGG